MGCAVAELGPGGIAPERVPRDSHGMTRIDPHLIEPVVPQPRRRFQIPQVVEFARRWDPVQECETFVPWPPATAPAVPAR